MCLSTAALVFDASVALPSTPLVYAGDNNPVRTGQHETFKLDWSYWDSFMSLLLETNSDVRKAKN